jgi:hypothetical protein
VGTDHRYLWTILIDISMANFYLDGNDFSLSSNNRQRRKLKTVKNKLAYHATESVSGTKLFIEQAHGLSINTKETKI